MAKKKEMRFGDALKKLEQSVERLEEDNIELEKFIDVFTEGMECAAVCQKKLNDAQQKIEVVLKDFNSTTESTTKDVTKDLRDADDEFFSEE